jgi:hypothetical protein
MTSLLEDFLTEECTDHVVSLLREEAKASSGEKYLTFNRFNVRLDLDARIATIEDELDPDEEVSLPLSQFLDHLSNPAP